MMSRREMAKAFGLMMAGVSSLMAESAFGRESQRASRPGRGDPKRSRAEVVIQHPLPDVKGKIGTLVLVSYAPGASSLPHRHPGSVFGYVLEGTVVMQFEPGPPTTYKQGQAFYEAPMHVHRISRNASKTRPAKLLAFQITEKGQPLLLPVK
ncbi:MAG: cupin domain-containing protein [Terriglobia bacterium]